MHNFLRLRVNLLIFLIIHSVYKSSYGLARRNTQERISSNKSALDERPRIVQGIPVAHSFFPFIVAIQRSGNGGYWGHSCGGSIITRSKVLTACHCVGDVSGTQVWVFSTYSLRIIAGTADVLKDSRDRQIRFVSRIIPHRKCSNVLGKMLSFDTAVITLNQPFTLTKEVQAVRVFSKNHKAAMDELNRLVGLQSRCEVAGWGRRNDPQSSRLPFQPSPTLQFANVRLMSSRACQQSFCRLANGYCQHDFFQARQLCARPAPVGSACHGDSGGPLYCNGYLFGVVSWGMRCMAGWPQVFANIEPILDMINNQAGARKSGSLERSESAAVSLSDTSSTVLWLFVILIMLRTHGI